MDFSEIMNIILSGGLVGTAAAIGSLRATVRKAKAEAMKAEADAEGVRVDNAEHATRVLVSNIVVPLKEELNATRKDLQANKREMARDCARPLTLPTVAAIMMTVLCLAGCASSRKSTTVEKIQTESASTDSASGSRRAGLVMAGIPASSVKLSIPADSLRKLPEGAVYRGKSGQANLTVGSDDSGNIVAEASCDSLQQLVLWYEEELARIRSETKSEISNDVQTVEKRPPNRMRTFITGVLAGLLAGVLLTIKLYKR